MTLNINSKNELLEFLNKKKIKFEKNFDLKIRSWIKAGGIFEFYLQPKNLDEIREILSFFKRKNLKFYTVGNLSNIIFRDGIIKTPILNLKNYDQIHFDEKKKDIITVKVSCGVSIFKFVNFVSKNLKITGLEGLVGIPGSLGGAIYMNASSYESYISEFLTEVEYINKFGEISILNKKNLKMNWRSSIFHEMDDVIILKAIFEFPKNNVRSLESINNKIEKTRNHRSKFQEKKFPNLGSLFATKDLYRDIKNFNFFYNFLYFLNKYSSKVILKFLNENHLIYFRKILVLLYSFLFNIKKRDPFILSDKTINCLINNGSNNANDAIKTIKKIQKKIGNSQKLENILIEDIE